MGMVYFIEHVVTRLWYYDTLFLRRDVWVPTGVGDTEYGWTNNPLKAKAYLLREEAERDMLGMKDVMITEHEFFSGLQ